MEHYDVLTPRQLKNQCRTFIKILQNNNEAIKVMQKNLQNFIQDDELVSRAYSSLKIQISDYLSILSAMISANELDIAEAGSLCDAVGDETLSGANILPNKQQAQTERDEHNNSAWFYSSKANNEPWTSLIKPWYMNVAAYHTARAQISNERYKHWCSKEEKFDEINLRTRALFTRSREIRRVAGSGLQSIRKAFGDGIYTPDLSASWRNSMLLENSKMVQDEKAKYILNVNGKQEYNWEAIEELMEKQPEDVTNAEYGALVSMISEMSEVDLQHLYRVAQKQENPFVPEVYHASEVFDEAAKRYLASAIVVAEVTLFDKYSKYEYDEVKVSNELSKALFVAEMVNSLYSISGKQHNIDISLEYSDNKITYIGEVTVSPGDTLNAGELLMADMNGRTIRVNPWGGPISVEKDLDDKVKSTLISLSPSLAGFLGEVGEEQLSNIVFDILGNVTTEGIAKVASLPYTTVQLMLDAKEDYENYVAINSAIQSVDLGNVVTAMDISASVISISGADDSAYLLCEKLNQEELFVRISAYNHDEGTEITISDIKEALRDNSPLLWDYVEWYTEGGGDSMGDYWEQLNRIATNSQLESENTDILFVEDMSIEQLQELINKYEDSSYEINVDILKGDNR